MKTRSQILAASAFRHVQAIEDRNEDFKGGYGRECLRFPSLVQSCGLLQTLAFLVSKGKPYQREFYNNLIATITDEAPGLDDFIEYLKNHASHIKYLTYTRKALQAALWYKRYAEAILKADPTDDSGESD